MVLIDHKHRPEALAGIGEGNGDRRGVDVEHGARIKSIPIDARHCLFVERRHFAKVTEVSETTLLLDRVIESPIGFGADKVVDGDGGTVSTFVKVGTVSPRFSMMIRPLCSFPVLPVARLIDVRQLPSLVEQRLVKAEAHFKLSVWGLQEPSSTPCLLEIGGRDEPMHLRMAQSPSVRDPW